MELHGHENEVRSIVTALMAYSWSRWWAEISAQETNPFLEHSIGTHHEPKFQKYI